MSIDISKITDAERDRKSVQALSDRPNSTQRGGISGLTPAQLKAAFDALPFLNTEKINAIIDALVGLDTTLSGKADKTTFQEIATSGALAYTLQPDRDTTLTSNAITSINITIPSGIAHGFYSGLNFNTGNDAPTFTVTNNSGLSFVYFKNGLQATFAPAANSIYQMVFFCDGQSVCCYIGEVS